MLLSLRRPLIIVVMICCWGTPAGLIVRPSNSGNLGASFVFAFSICRLRMTDSPTKVFCEEICMRGAVWAFTGMEVAQIAIAMLKNKLGFMNRFISRPFRNRLPIAISRSVASAGFVLFLKSPREVSVSNCLKHLHCFFVVDVFQVFCHGDTIREWRSFLRKWECFVG